MQSFKLISINDKPTLIHIVKKSHEAYNLCKL